MMVCWVDAADNREASNEGVKREGGDSGGRERNANIVGAEDMTTMMTTKQQQSAVDAAGIEEASSKGGEGGGGR